MADGAIDRLGGSSWVVLPRESVEGVQAPRAQGLEAFCAVRVACQQLAVMEKRPGHGADKADVVGGAVEGEEVLGCLEDVVVRLHVHGVRSEHRHRDTRDRPVPFVEQIAVRGAEMLWKRQICSQVQNINSHQNFIQQTIFHLQRRKIERDTNPWLQN